MAPINLPEFEAKLNLKGATVKMYTDTETAARRFRIDLHIQGELTVDEMTYHHAPEAYIEFTAETLREDILSQMLEYVRLHGGREIERPCWLKRDMKA